MKRIVFFLVLGLMPISCKLPGELSNRESDEIVALARTRILEVLPTLDDPMRHAILNVKPRIACYSLSHDFAQYSLHWDVGSNRVLIVGEGNIKKLDGAKISIFPKPLP